MGLIGTRFMRVRWRQVMSRLHLNVRTPPWQRACRATVDAIFDWHTSFTMDIASRPEIGWFGRCHDGLFGGHKGGTSHTPSTSTPDEPTSFPSVEAGVWFRGRTSGRVRKLDRNHGGELLLIVRTETVTTEAAGLSSPDAQVFWGRRFVQIGRAHV